MTAVFDVLVETDDIVVLGPPTSIDLSLDVGPKGDRGSRFFVGSGNPNLAGVIPSGQNPLVGDVFVNSSTASEYGWLYLYISTPSGNSWVPALRLQPSIYSTNIGVLFNSSGEGTITIPIANIVADITILDVEKYVTQITAINSNPVAMSVTSKSILGPNLNIFVKGIEYNGSSWANLEGIVNLEITISVI